MGAVYEPDVFVEFAFGYGPLDASPVWTDSAGAWREISSRRGRGSEFDQFTPGSMTVVLKDETRRFDPLNTSGPYYGQLVPNVPIRIYATHSAADYPIFYGYVDGWDYQLSGANNVGWVTVNATDGFKLLSRKRLPDPFRDSVEAFGVLGWWRFDQLSGGGFTDDIDGTILGTIAVQSGTYQRTGQTVTQGLNEHSFGAVLFPEFEAVNLDTYYQYGVSDPGATAELVPGTAWTVSCWVSVVSPPDNTFGVFRVIDSPDFVALVVTITGAIELAVGNSALTVTTNENYCDGQPHHVVCVRDSTTITLYVDGVVKATGTNGAYTGTLTTASLFAVGEVGVGTPANAGTMPAWTLDELVFIGQTLTAAEVTELYEAFSSLYGGTVQTGERHGDILDLVGWPAGLRDIDTGELTVGPQDVAGNSALSELLLVDATEQGRTFIAADGTYTVHDALTMAANTAASVVFSDDGSDVGYLSSQFRMSMNDRNIYNEAQVTREGGVRQTASDSTSIAAYGPSTRSLSGLLMVTDGQAQNLAERIVYRYKDPQTRVESWTVNPQYNTSTWASVLGVEIGDHVQLEVRPVNTGTREVIDLDIEQIVTTITPSRFEFTFIGSARDPNIGGYFTWGGDGSTQGWGTAGVWR